MGLNEGHKDTSSCGQKKKCWTYRLPKKQWGYEVPESRPEKR